MYLEYEESIEHEFAPLVHSIVPYRLLSTNSVDEKLMRAVMRTINMPDKNEKAAEKRLIMLFNN